MAQAVPERLDGLARENTAGGVGDGAGDHHGHALAGVLKELVDGEQRRLGIERVEDGLDQEHIRATFEQRLALFVVRVAQLIEADVARARVVHVRRDAGRLGRRAEGAGHEARALGRAVLVAGFACDAGGHHVHLVGQVRHLVVFLRDGRRAEGIGFDQVRTGGQVLLVNLADDLRPCQQQQLVVAFHVDRVIGETLAAVLRLVELVALDHGAHCAVQDQDALAQQRGQVGGTGVGQGRGHGETPRCSGRSDIQNLRPKANFTSRINDLPPLWAIALL